MPPGRLDSPLFPAPRWVPSPLVKVVQASPIGGLCVERASRGFGQTPESPQRGPRVDLTVGPALVTCSLRQGVQKCATGSRERQKKTLSGAGDTNLGIDHDRGCEEQSTMPPNRREEIRSVVLARPARAASPEDQLFFSLVNLKVGNAAR